MVMITSHNDDDIYNNDDDISNNDDDIKGRHWALAGGKIYHGSLEQPQTATIGNCAFSHLPLNQEYLSFKLLHQSVSLFVFCLSVFQLKICGISKL